MWRKYFQCLRNFFLLLNPTGGHGCTIGLFLSSTLAALVSALLQMRCFSTIGSYHEALGMRLPFAEATNQQVCIPALPTSCLPCTESSRSYLAVQERVFYLTSHSCVQLSLREVKISIGRQEFRGRNKSRGHEGSSLLPSSPGFPWHTCYSQLSYHPHSPKHSQSGTIHENVLQTHLTIL